MNNKNDESLNDNEVEMAKKRIYNPVTGTYYAIKQRTTEFGKKAEIKGKWKNPK